MESRKVFFVAHLIFRKPSQRLVELFPYERKSSDHRKPYVHHPGCNTVFRQEFASTYPTLKGAPHIQPERFLTTILRFDRFFPPKKNDH